MRPAMGEPSAKPSLPAPALQPRSKDTLRVGCIGAGGFARGIIFPHLRSTAGLQLESVASSTGAAAASARTGFGFTIAQSPSELLDNPNLDAVFILTRHNSHAAYVQERARSRQAGLRRKTAGDQSRAAGNGANGVRAKLWRKADRPSSWWGSIAVSRRLRKSSRSSLAAAPKPCLSISAAMLGSSLAAAGFRIRRTGADCR